MKTNNIAYLKNIIAYWKINLKIDYFVYVESLICVSNVERKWKNILIIL